MIACNWKDRRVIAVNDEDFSNFSSSKSPELAQSRWVPQILMIPKQRPQRLTEQDSPIRIEPESLPASPCRRRGWSSARSPRASMCHSVWVRKSLKRKNAGQNVAVNPNLKKHQSIYCFEVNVGLVYKIDRRNTSFLSFSARSVRRVRAVETWNVNICPTGWDRQIPFEFGPSSPQASGREPFGGGHDQWFPLPPLPNLLLSHGRDEVTVQPTDSFHGA